MNIIELVKAIETLALEKYPDCHVTVNITAELRKSPRYLSQTYATQIVVLNSSTGDWETPFIMISEKSMESILETAKIKLAI